MKKIITNKGFIIYEASVSEIFQLGGFGICDDCNNYAPTGILVPVLNYYMCKQCYENWHKNTPYCEEDRQAEKETALYYEKKILLK